MKTECFTHTLMALAFMSGAAWGTYTPETEEGRTSSLHLVLRLQFPQQDDSSNHEEPPQVVGSSYYYSENSSDLTSMDETGFGDNSLPSDLTVHSSSETHTEASTSNSVYSQSSHTTPTSTQGSDSPISEEKERVPEKIMSKLQIGETHLMSSENFVDQSMNTQQTGTEISLPPKTTQQPKTDPHAAEKELLRQQLAALKVTNEQLERQAVQQKNQIVSGGKHKKKKKHPHTVEGQLGRFFDHLQKGKF